MIPAPHLINVIDKYTYSKMKDVKLQHANLQAFAYITKTPVALLGRFDNIVETEKSFVVKAARSGNLLSGSTTQDLGSVSFRLNQWGQCRNLHIGVP